MLWARKRNVIIQPVPVQPLRRWRKAAILLGTLSLSAAPLGSVKPLAAYHNGREIIFTPVAADTHLATVGPWTLGHRLTENKPQDRRLNLYVVVPGGQYRSQLHPEYDHNLIVNKITPFQAREWDVYWCFILDSSLPDDIRSERELLVAAHENFRPADLFDFIDIPAHDVMAREMSVKAMPDLKKFRHKDKSLPRVLIVPARLGLRGTAKPPQQEPAATAH